MDIEELQWWYVSTHSRLKAAGRNAPAALAQEVVSTHSRLKAAGRDFQTVLATLAVSTHSRLKAAGIAVVGGLWNVWVSTHSRLKAAGGRRPRRGLRAPGFNTQPPEGGWRRFDTGNAGIDRFQHTAA